MPQATIIRVRRADATLVWELIAQSPSAMLLGAVAQSSAAMLLGAVAQSSAAILLGRRPSQPPMCKCKPSQKSTWP